MKKKNENFELPQAIEEWKKLGITSCTMNFSCGGDSMGDWNFEFYKNGEGEVKVSDELKDFIENDVFKRVEFYVNSDGHYIGEAGTVEITLYDEDGEENESFNYIKTAQAEWNETVTEMAECELTEDEVKFLKNKIQTVEGDSDSEANFIYKKDCFLSNKELEIRNGLTKKLNEIARDYEFNYSDGEEDVYEWYRFQIDMTGQEDNEKIEMSVTRTFVTYSESID